MNSDQNPSSWADPSRFVKHLHVERPCLELDYTQEIINRWGNGYDIVEERGEPGLDPEEYPENLTEGKQHLFLSLNRGRFFKPCPATREYRCCEYQVLNIGMNCPMDCVYCILQAYLNRPWLSFFVNIDQMFSEMEDAFDDHQRDFFRIGTGEFTDSLAIDRITGLSAKLVSFMAQRKKAILELKTKSAFIDNLKGLDHQGRTVVAWSLNATAVMQKEELRTANLEERLGAAARCAKWGYLLGFHFDPIIEHDGWQEGYEVTISRIFEVVPAERIAWISLGALRFLPKLKQIGTGRFPGSRIYFQEFIEGLDGKQRYFRTGRVELYCHIYKLLKERCSERTCIYFCMESDEIWQEVMGFVPEARGGLPKMLDLSVSR
ncbi:MAG: spore photoproduct lyase family protein [Thermodesulfobacteriota bacterium]